jgi:2-polyprenyl-3-methyl-5-hydroxy-6-metoxy-1,4-benzoquinol methylase
MTLKVKEAATQHYADYGHSSVDPGEPFQVLIDPVFGMAGPLNSSTRVLDVGCGTGYLASLFLQRGCKVVGVDLSERGNDIARKHYPSGRFEVLPADEDILENLGEEPFDIVVSTEVVEHLYAPRPYAAGCFRALKGGGRIICSTPYHGYFKNIAIAMMNKFDSHVNPLWDGGHIKFWSRRTLAGLLSEAGFVKMQFRGAGRVPFLWMSMVISAEKPTSARRV